MNERRPQPPRDPEPSWVQWWRSHPTGKPIQHIETKGKRKRSRRQRKRSQQ